MSLRWGIAGVSKISHDFCVALDCKFTEYDHKVIAIASKCKERAENFGKSHGITRIWSDYKDLAADDEVEVVFVAVLNPYHYEVCKLLIEHGKHILCAKPMCMNRDQVKDILELAKLKAVFVMEGLWSRFFPLYRYLSRLIEMKSLTSVKEVYVKHGYIATDIERITKKDLGGGLVLDIGVDAIQFVVFIYREKPRSIRASGKVNSEGIDLYFEVEMQFSGDRKATVICSGLQEFKNQATVITRKGPIIISDYQCPTKLFGFNGGHEWLLKTTDISLNFKNSLGIRYMADEVMKSIRSGKLECSIVPAHEMLLIAQIQDEIRKQIGVRYECDKR